MLFKAALHLSQGLKAPLRKASAVSLLCASAIVLLEQQPASAFIVFVPGYGNFDVQVQNTLFDSLNPPASQMPWWNDQPAANAFATAVGSGLGSVEIPNLGESNLGPFFAWETDGSQVSMDAFCIGARCFGLVGAADSAFSFVPGGPAESPDVDNPYPWAIATQVPSTSNVPGPIPLFGVAAAFAFSRKLRVRLNAKHQGGDGNLPEAGHLPGV